MVLTVGPDLEAALSEQSRRQGISADRLALDALRRQFLSPAVAGESHEGWTARLRGAASDCGVSLPHEAVGSDGLYE
jgi:hypothetical protein